MRAEDGPNAYRREAAPLFHPPFLQVARAEEALALRALERGAPLATRLAATLRAVPLGDHLLVSEEPHDVGSLLLAARPEADLLAVLEHQAVVVAEVAAAVLADGDARSTATP